MFPILMPSGKDQLCRTIDRAQRIRLQVDMVISIIASALLWLWRPRILDANLAPAHQALYDGPSKLERPTLGL